MSLSVLYTHAYALLPFATDACIFLCRVILVFVHALLRVRPTLPLLMMRKCRSQHHFTAGAEVGETVATR